MIYPLWPQMNPMHLRRLSFLKTFLVKYNGEEIDQLYFYPMNLRQGQVKNQLFKIFGSYELLMTCLYSLFVCLFFFAVNWSVV